MASINRKEALDSAFTIPENVRIASVMLLLFKPEDSDQLRTVLIQRSQNPNDRHSGQVSFPGGSWEPGDGSLEAVALREAYEEVGISPLQIKILGRLSELYIPVSNFLVHPYVGFIHGKAEFTPQPGEVAKVLTPQVDVFYRPEYRKITDVQVAGMTIRDVPYFDVDGHIVWGATAMMLSEFTQAIQPPF